MVTILRIWFLFLAIGQYIDGYIEFLNYSFFSEKAKFYDNVNVIRDILFEQHYLEPMDFKVGSVVVKYITNDFDGILNKESLKVNNYD